MNRRERNTAYWAELKESLENGDLAPPIFVNPSGDLVLSGGPRGGQTIPPHVAKLFPLVVVQEAMRERDKWQEKERAGQEARLAEREAQESQIDEPGFTLIAGEDSKVVATGTLRECRKALWRVTFCERDGYAGRGCWIIFKGDDFEERGYFDRQMYW